MSMMARFRAVSVDTLDALKAKPSLVRELVRASAFGAETSEDDFQMFLSRLSLPPAARREFANLPEDEKARFEQAMREQFARIGSEEVRQLFEKSDAAAERSNRPAYRDPLSVNRSTYKRRGTAFTIFFVDRRSRRTIR